jgi:hypothetical protein
VAASPRPRRGRNAGLVSNQRRDRSIKLNAILTRLEDNVGDLAADLTATGDEPSRDGDEPDTAVPAGPDNIG